MKTNLPITLRDSEAVLLVCREHWLKLAGTILGIAVIFLLPFFFLAPLFDLGVIGIAVFGFVIFCCAFYAVREYFRWDRTQLVITTARLAYVDQQGLVTRLIVEVFYPHLLDVEQQTKGVLQTLGKYGTLHIRAAGRPDALVVANVPKPAAVRQVLLDARDASLGGRPQATKGSWWWQRFTAMEAAEQQQLLERLFSKVDDSSMRDLFRPAVSSPDTEVKK